MTSRAKSSRKPVLESLSRYAMVSPTTFSESYAEEHAWITGRDGEPIEKLRFSTLYERWWIQPEATKAAASAGQVVHWSLKNRCRDDLIAPILLEVERVIAALDPDTVCVLDEFRREETPLYLWAILGPAGTLVKTHQDMFGTASWNLLLSGSKQWTFWAKEKSPDVDAPCFSFQQNPSQVIWIPEDWWHRVTYDESSLCLSKNLVLRRTLPIVQKRVAADESVLARHLAAVAALRHCEISSDAVD